MTMLKKALISLAGMVFMVASYADVRNDIPSCYRSVNLDPPAVEVGRELIVVIDGTFDPDVDLKKSVHTKVQRFIAPSDRVSVVSFSSYIGDAYTKLHFSGRLEPVIPAGERNSISKALLRQLDRCMTKQMAFTRKSIDNAIMAGFKTAEFEAPKTEIIGNLSRVLDPLLHSGQEGRPAKTVLLVSDMLENSDITSFYRSGGVRPINASSEIEKVKSGQYISNWHSANVYIIGAGWVHQKYRHGFRGSDVMRSLESFWSKYFELSNAKLIEFGQPVLMRELN